MNSFKKTLLAAFVLLGSFSSYFADAKDVVIPLESRLQQLPDKKNDSEKLHSLFNLYWDWRMEENPEEASYMGYPGKYDRWTDLSPEAIAQRDQFSNQLLNILNTIEASHLEDEDKVSYSILKRMLEEDQQESQFCSHYLLINQMQGIQLSISLVLEMMPAKTVDDFENVLSRLRKLPLLFQQITFLLEKGLQNGITPPRITIKHVPQQILNQMTDQPLQSPLLRSFQKFPESFAQADKDRLIEEASHIYQEAVFPALNQFYSFLKDNYIPNCRKSTAFSDLPNGKQWYAHRVQTETTTQLTPEEIHSIGLKEVERIKNEMTDVFKKSQFQGSFSEFLNFLKTDPQFFYSDREQLLQGYQILTRYIESKLHLLFFKLPALPFEVVPIPSYSEESQIAAYYCQGSVSENRPGYFFINTSSPEKRPKWEMEPLALHEAVPGHHLQIALAQEFQGIPEFRKHANFTSYIEGWGLYAESLGSAFGLYQDPYSTFGRLTYEMMRAVRLVVDTGMHAMGWSREQAIDYFKQHVCVTDHEIETEVDRYLVMPGQALAYKIGELKIKEMRRIAKEALGDKFDIREFHQAWLQHGTVPLDIAEAQIYQWIKQSQEKS